MIQTVIAGAAGRMGGMLISLMSSYPQLRLSAACDQPGSPKQGLDSGLASGAAANGVMIGGDLAAALQGAQLLIDFTHAGATAANLDAARAAGAAVLLGTTGWQGNADAEDALARASRAVPVLPSANMSIGVALLARLVRQAAATLGPEFDIEIIEAHHRMKVDAPSGTALLLGQAAAAGRGTGLDVARATVDRHGAARRQGDIGFATVRGGDVVGEHAVHFLGPGERLVLQHSATDRALFARGALQAGSWLASQPPGRYELADYLAAKS